MSSHIEEDIGKERAKLKELQSELCKLGLLANEDTSTVGGSGGVSDSSGVGGSSGAGGIGLVGGNDEDSDGNWSLGEYTGEEVEDVKFGLNRCCHCNVLCFGNSHSMERFNSFHLLCPLQAPSLYQRSLILTARCAPPCSLRLLNGWQLLLGFCCWVVNCRYEKNRSQHQRGERQDGSRSTTVGRSVAGLCPRA